MTDFLKKTAPSAAVPNSAPSSKHASYNNTKAAVKTHVPQGKHHAKVAGK